MSSGILMIPREKLRLSSLFSTFMERCSQVWSAGLSRSMFALRVGALSMTRHVLSLSQRSRLLMALHRLKSQRSCLSWPMSSPRPPSGKMGPGTTISSV